MSENPRQSEATDAATGTIEFRGIEFTFPRNFDDYSVDLMESIEEGKTVGIVRGFLGPDQWRRVKSMNLTMRDLGELSDKIAKAAGFGDAGESSASSA